MIDKKFNAVLRAINFDDYHWWVIDNLSNETEQPLYSHLKELCEKHEYTPSDDDLEKAKNHMMVQIYQFSPLLYAYYDFRRVTSMVAADAIYLMAAIHKDGEFDS